MEESTPSPEQKRKQRRVIIACGGTGGHLFPGIAVAEELMKRGHAVKLIISEKEIDTFAVRGRDDLDYERMPSIGMPKLLSLKFLKFLGSFWKGYRQCRKMVRAFEADTVLGMGGFTSTAPVLSGRRLKCATFIHESNSVPGKANRLNARFADTVLLGLSECARYFPKNPTEVVGTPLRVELTVPTEKEEALAKLGLKTGLKTILVMGGSQGARQLNRNVCEMASFLNAGEVQVIHITGRGEDEACHAAWEASGVTHFVAPFYHEMQDVYAVADIAVSRAGASSIAELTYFGLPSILVPYPFAADDHQKKNAEIVEAAGAGFLRDESGLTGEALAEIVNDLVRDEPKRVEVSKKSSALGMKDAAIRICNHIEQAPAE